MDGVHILVKQSLCTGSSPTFKKYTKYLNLKYLDSTIIKLKLNQGVKHLFQQQKSELRRWPQLPIKIILHLLYLFEKVILIFENLMIFRMARRIYYQELRHFRQMIGLVIFLLSFNQIFNCHTSFPLPSIL